MSLQCDLEKYFRCSKAWGEFYLRVTFKCSSGTSSINWHHITGIIKLYGYQNLFVSSCHFHCYEKWSWNIMSKKLENKVVFIFKHKQSNSKPVFSFLPWISKNHSWCFLGKVSIKINKLMHKFEWSPAKVSSPGNLSEYLCNAPVALHSVGTLCVRTNGIETWMLKVKLGEDETNLPLCGWVGNPLVGCSTQTLIALCYWGLCLSQCCEQVSVSAQLAFFIQNGADTNLEFSVCVTFWIPHLVFISGYKSMHFPKQFSMQLCLNWHIADKNGLW